MKVWFDMDGTIADLYAVDGWLAMLRAFDPKPYLMAKPLVNMSLLARLIHQAQSHGIEIGIISWCSKCSTDSYDEAVKRAKQAWLKRHLPSVEWNSVKIVPYGQDKWEVCGKEGILFDDEARNRDTWRNGQAYEPDDIITILKELGRDA